MTPPQNAPAVPDGPELAGVAVRSTMWQGLAFVLGRAATMAATVVVARLLGPAEFGLVGIALFFIVFAETISAFGAAEALVYVRPDRRSTDAALVIALGAAAGLCLIGAALAPAVADFFGHADVTGLCRASLLGLFVGAAGQVPDALLRRDLRFKRRLVTEVTRAVVQAAVSITLAAAGLGAWALVWGYVASNFAWAVGSWALASYRPRAGWWRIRRDVARPLLAFGIPASGQALLAALIFDVDYVIVGRVLGPEALGEYTLAFRIPQLLVLSVFSILSMVAFPLFSRVRGDPGRLRRGYLTGVRLQSAYGLAVSVGLAVAAPPLVLVVFGPRWAGAAEPLQGLAFYAAFRAVGAGAADVYKGIGRPGLAAAVSLVRLLVLVPVLLVAAPHGTAAVAWAQAGTALVFAVLMQSVACRVLDVRAREFAAALRPALALAAGVASGAAIGRFGVSGTVELQLAMSVLAAAALGLAAVWIVDRGFVRDTVALLVPHRRAAAT